LWSVASEHLKVFFTAYIHVLVTSQESTGRCELMTQRVNLPLRTVYLIFIEQKGVAYIFCLRHHSNTIWYW